MTEPSLPVDPAVDPDLPDDVDEDLDEPIAVQTDGPAAVDDRQSQDDEAVR